MSNETVSCLSLCPDCNDRNKGALEELKKVEKEMNKYFSGAFAKQYVQKRIKELEGGVEK